MNWPQVQAAAACGGLLAGLALGRCHRVRGTTRVRRVLCHPPRGDAAAALRNALAAVRRAAGPDTVLRRLLVPELALLPVGLAAGRSVHSVVPVLAAAAGVVPLRRWRRWRRTAGEAGRRAAAVIELCAGLVGELRSGATPEQALQAVVARSSALRRDLGAEAAARLAAARYGADVPAALHLVAEQPGGGGAAAVAACWQVSCDSGTGLVVGLDQLADALRAERALSEEVAGELAGSRTTIALLAVLPAFGLLLGGALGAHPLAMLLHTPAGLACFTVGGLLEAAGLMWTARIVRTAEDRPEHRPPMPVHSCGLRRRRGDREEPIAEARHPARTPRSEVAT
ncbi:type II secretion system F family protein [Kitasatospora sp. KL5]|uniref:type II secretion system F family protein n=1 Tax=Kitasatospora sp. KL5 TaxID=3425125 RepID=UPI003D700170